MALDRSYIPARHPAVVRHPGCDVRRIVRRWSLVRSSLIGECKTCSNWRQVIHWREATGADSPICGWYGVGGRKRYGARRNGGSRRFHMAEEVAILLSGHERLAIAID